MPIYEYECSKCGVFEAIQKPSEKPLKCQPECPHKDCPKDSHRLISQSAFHLKGGGWYKTDYASSGASSAASKKSSDSKTTETKSSESASADSSPSKSDNSKTDTAKSDSGDTGKKSLKAKGGGGSGSGGCGSGCGCH